MILGWVAETRPRIFVLTDGSGRHGAPRIESTAKVARAAGAEEGTIWGAFTDRAFYEAILSANVDVFVDVAARAYPELAAEAEAAFRGTSRKIFAEHEDLAAIVDESIDGVSEASFGVECLFPAPDLPPPKTERPFYEIYGERLVASGVYEQAIRYREHVQPIERALGAFR
jgi:hypothetical protein